jgi:S1-C subfamily serine protease
LLFNKYSPGDVLSLEVHRDGETITLELELGERPQ